LNSKLFQDLYELCH